MSPVNEGISRIAKKINITQVVTIILEYISAETAVINAKMTTAGPDPESHGRVVLYIQVVYITILGWSGLIFKVEGHLPGM
jgi:hypothetical protein